MTLLFSARIMQLEFESFIGHEEEAIKEPPGDPTPTGPWTLLISAPVSPGYPKYGRWGKIKK